MTEDHGPHFEAEKRSENDAGMRYEHVKTRMNKAAERYGVLAHPPKLIAVSKTFSGNHIIPLLKLGQKTFGENRVQEAMEKWPELKTRYKDVELHLIGPLQTNKVRDAIALFDVIETLDREKLAIALAKEMKASGKNLDCFVQVNIGNEPQKSGISIDDVVVFVKTCRDVHGLNIVGLMCIPPVEHAPGPYFAQMHELAKQADVKCLSMGMSSDFEVAIGMGATHVRVGSALFGVR